MSDRGLDFEKAEKDTACGSKLMVEMAVSGVRHHLNTQLSARIAEAREQERKVVREAYREGWNECIRSGPTDQSRGDSWEKCWESSDAKAASFPVEEAP